MTELYDHNVYNAKKNLDEENKDTPYKEEIEKILNADKRDQGNEQTPNEAENPSDQANRNKKSWTELEIIKLLRGIYQYGETRVSQLIKFIDSNGPQIHQTNWSLIKEKFDFPDKTPHDLSVKWMDIKYQMMIDLDRLNKKHSNSVTKMSWLVACLRKLEENQGIYNENDEVYKNIRNFHINLKNKMMKPKKSVVTTIETQKGDIIQIS